MIRGRGEKSETRKEKERGDKWESRDGGEERRGREKR